MSEYLNNFDFDAFMAEPFDFDFLGYPDPIGQNEANYDYNATYGFDPGMDFGADPALNFDFNAGFQPGPSLPLLPDATTTVDQSNTIDQFVCKGCDRSFDDQSLLKSHGHDKGAIKVCGFSGCNSRFYKCKSLLTHRATPHLPNHHAVWDDSAIACAECNGTFDSPAELSQHANACKHSSYECSCGVKFARHDVLLRHLNGFAKKGIRYECTFCRRHLGKQAFRRSDHLVQHLRGYHNMEQEKINNVVRSSGPSPHWDITACSHADCEAYRDPASPLPWIEKFKGRPFQKQSDYSKHMRDVHKESDFSCPVSSCERVGVKGYMREKDLKKHIANKHPEAPSISYVRPEHRIYR